VATRQFSPDMLGVLASAVESALDAVMVTDADLDAPGPRILYVNDAFTRMTGWTPGDLVGRTPRVLQGPATDRETLDRLRDDLREHGSFQGQAVNYRRDGTPFVMEWSIASIRDGDGAPAFYVAVQRDITEFRRRLAEAETQARRDDLTGIANRRHLTMAMAAALADPAVHPRVALVVLDIDRFKDVNDAHGHPAGDVVLRVVAERLSGAVRRDDMVARIGGEEFAVLIRTAVSRQDAVGLAERLRAVVAAAPVPLPAGSVTVTVSAGVADAGEAGQAADALMALADRRLYAAKRAGRDRVVADGD
jgi:diguanylate cyclase (GGDEF)-like protein/PAS domain S-box-containing protein